MTTLLIKNIQITDYRGSQISDVLIENERIKKIGPSLEGADTIIDGMGKVLMPSFIDLHAHFRDPGLTYKEDIETGSMAALKGGYTHVFAMANTKPVCDNRETYDYIINKSKDLDLIDLYQNYAVTKGLEGRQLSNFDEIKGLKFISDDGKGILSNHMMYQACLKAKEKGVGIMVHAEDPEISPYDYRIAEDIITLRDIYLSKITGCNIHFSHVSTKGSTDLIRKGKAEGANITSETTPHHLYFSDMDYRVNPPIRTGNDVDELVKGLLDGTIDAISTDHAPHSKEDKEKGSPGMIGLETAFSALYTSLISNKKLTLEDLSRVMSYNPGNILKIDHGKIEEEQVANLVIVNLDTKWEVKKDDFASKSKNSPFIGQVLEGRVEATIRKGKIWRF